MSMASSSLKITRSLLLSRAHFLAAFTHQRPLRPQCQKSSRIYSRRPPTRPGHCLPPAIWLMLRLTRTLAHLARLPFLHLHVHHPHTLLTHYP
ncbi:hypothetical protein C8R46DRAFT_216296 [Mycena filopes]|nr:hypothetical protein C8R46DRAFT_216296 [Mycena filopes]